MTLWLILGAIVAGWLGLRVFLNAREEAAFQRLLDEERRETLERFHADQRAQYERRKFRESFSNWPMGPKGDR